MKNIDNTGFLTNFKIKFNKTFDIVPSYRYYDINNKTTSRKPINMVAANGRRNKPQVVYIKKRGDLMNEETAKNFSHVEFDEEELKMFSEIIEHDDDNVKILFYITECYKNNKPVTMKSIAENVKVDRRVAVKNAKSEIVSYTPSETYIDRKAAEKIIERLAGASLIYFEVQLPYKFIKLTNRGMQVALHIIRKKQK